MSLFHDKVKYIFSTQSFFSTLALIWMQVRGFPSAVKWAVRRMVAEWMGSGTAGRMRAEVGRLNLPAGKGQRQGIPACDVKKQNFIFVSRFEIIPQNATIADWKRAMKFFWMIMIMIAASLIWAGDFSHNPGWF